MRTRTFKVPVGEALDIAMDADYIRVRSASVVLFLENDNGDKIEISEGEDVTGWPVKRLRVSHEDAAVQTIKLTYGKGGRQGSAKVGGSVAISGSVTVGNFPANHGALYQERATIGNGGSTQIRPAKADRRYLFVQNNDPIAVMRVMLGASATATIGVRLQPGEWKEWDTFVPNQTVNCILESAAGASSYNCDFIEG